MKPDIIRAALLRFQELAEAEGETTSGNHRQRSRDRDLARLALKKYLKTQGWHHRQKPALSGTPEKKARWRQC
jgi:hypothetical protein